MAVLFPQYLFWLAVVFTAVSMPSLAASVERRASPFTNPADYQYAWTDTQRCSYGSSSYIKRTPIDDATSVTQREVNICAARCNRQSNCGFFHVIQMKGGSEGNVLCALYTKTQPKSASKYNDGTSSHKGTVTVSYGFSKLLTTTTSKRTTSTTSSKRTTSTAKSSTTTQRSTTVAAPTTTSTTSTTRTGSRTGSHSKTSTVPAAPTNSNYPNSPNGATLVQFRPCKSHYTIPMFVNKNYPVRKDAVSTSDTVWLVQHGSVRDFNDSFDALYRVIGDAGVIIAPNFYAKGDVAAPTTWYVPNSTLAWPDNDWYSGDDAISPADAGECSSFDVMDTLIDSLRNTTRFPNLKRIISVSHSGGASFMGRYGMLTDNTDITYVMANTPAMPYFTTARPIPPQDCKYFMAWGYGFTYSLPRYVAANNPGPIQAFKNWAKLDVTLMTGTYDTYARDPSGDQSCYAVCEGGQNRRDRGYAYWAYLNLLGGTDTDVSDYYGYDALKSQVDAVSPKPSFKIRHCNVDGVWHYNYGMYSSACGRAAINGESTLPADPGPLRPSGLSS